MALLADYTNLTDVAISSTDLNPRYSALYTLLGTISSLRGTLNWENLAAAAGLRSDQLADVAVVCNTGVSGTGAQTISKGTRFDAGSERHNTGATNRGTTLSNADNTTVTTRAKWQKWVPTAALTINTLQPNVLAEGDKITIVVDNSGSGGSFTLTHTLANTLNGFRLKGAANRTISTLQKGTIGTFVYGSPSGEANNMWWEE